jgi:hypothetical protein
MEVREETSQGVLIPAIDAGAECDERDSAIHSAGIQKLEAETASQRASSTAFSSSGGTVNGDYHREYSWTVFHSAGEQPAVRD